MNSTLERWVHLPISDVATFGSGELISVAKLSKQSGMFPVPVFGGNGIAGYTSSATVLDPTVILGRVGQKCGAVYRNDGPAWITDNALYARRFKRPVDIRFFALALEAARLNDVKNKNDLPLITQSILNDVKIPWPESLAEQRHIADTVSVVDDLIATLERTIAKREALKQGLLQQLVTGQTRLPNFIKSWNSVKLRDAGATYGGLTGKTKEDFGIGRASFVTFTEVMAGPRLRGQRLERVTVRAGERQNQVERGDILFNGSSETPEEVALAAAVHFDPPAATYLNSFCFGYRVNRSDLIEPTYLAYYFRAGVGRTLVSSLAQGATRYNIAKTKFLELSPALPALDEQRAIAQVLSHADDEITAVKGRLAKANAIKQGMMQQLLTGRTRLPVEAAS